MAFCKKCGKNVGCGCKLDANGLCSTCRDKKEEKQ